ncbi:type II toxin-antitoxin system HicB family antitoxin [Candidatus Gracilibacteria bacterium]|nr:type II toxin-antitoxin system HicB family antitoxin [Candidatus Gracilibacteria bacterium]
MKNVFTSIVFQGEKFWVAKCVELGVTSQGMTRGNALENLREALELFLEG